VHARLMPVQAVRRKRAAIDGAATEDTWTQHVAERSMVKVTDPDSERLEAASPRASPEEVSTAGSAEAPVATPAPHGDQKIEESVSENNTNLHGMAFETSMSEQPLNQGLGRPDATGLRNRRREAMTGSRLAGRELPANGRQSLGRTAGLVCRPNVRMRSRAAGAMLR